jgi:hypothetical protein
MTLIDWRPLACCMLSRRLISGKESRGIAGSAKPVVAAVNDLTVGLLRCCRAWLATTVRPFRGFSRPHRCLASGTAVFGIRIGVSI